MMRAAVLASFVVAGCSDPTFALRFRVTDGLADACKGANDTQVTQCEDVPMSCAAVASIRVFNPNTPTSPVINVCQELMMASKPTLCEIAQVNLPPPKSPVDAQTLEVQILVYPKYQLQLDPLNNNAPICPAMVSIGIDGFPTPSLVPCMADEVCDPTPAVGGIAFYHPGDEETVVELGCSDLGQLNEQACTGATTQFTVSVIDFDTLVSVSAALAPHLTVEVGTPTTGATGTTFNAIPPDLTLAATSTPSWSGFLAQKPPITCIQVDEADVAARTDTVSCRESSMSDPTPLSFVGTRLAKGTLDDIVAALGLPAFPDEGLVVGIVLDYHGNPAGGLQVAASDVSTTIQYLSADHHSVGGTTTSPAGIFLAKNAPFGTEFSATQNDQTAQVVGGLIAGKVTIVVLQIPHPTSG